VEWSLASTGHLTTATGLSIKKIVHELQSVQTATIGINGQRLTVPAAQPRPTSSTHYKVTRETLINSVSLGLNRFGAANRFAALSAQSSSKASGTSRVRAAYPPSSHGSGCPPLHGLATTRPRRRSFHLRSNTTRLTAHPGVPRRVRVALEPAPCPQPGHAVLPPAATRHRRRTSHLPRTRTRQRDQTRPTESARQPGPARHARIRRHPPSIATSPPPAHITMTHNPMAGTWITHRVCPNVDRARIVERSRERLRASTWAH